MELAVYLIITGITIAVALAIVFKLRSMDRYIILLEKNEDGLERWFVKVRRGLFYYYLEQTEDAPGYENDIFKTSKHQVGGQETEILAEKLLYNHRLTTIDGIQREGE